MKLSAFFMVSLMSLSAFALEHHFGKTSSRGFEYTCSLYNKTNRTLDMKYVVFVFSSASGDNPEYEVQNRIDKRVRSGETLRSSVHETNAFSVHHCYYLAR